MDRKGLKGSRKKKKEKRGKMLGRWKLDDGLGRIKKKEKREKKKE